MSDISRRDLTFAYNDGVNDLLEHLSDFIDRHRTALNTELLEIRKDEDSPVYVIEQIKGRLTAYGHLLSFIEWYDRYVKDGGMAVRASRARVTESDV